MTEPDPVTFVPRPPVRARRRMDPRDHRPDFRSDEPAGPPLLPGTQDEHDDQTLPYEVPGSGTENCSYCQGELPLHATFCVHCGTNLLTGEVAQTKRVKPFLREWEEGLPWATRFRVFLVLLFVDGFLTLGTMVISGQTFTSLSVIVSHGVGNLLLVCLQAFILGTYDSLEVRRNSKGAAIIQLTRRIAFLKVPPWRIDWKASIGVGVVARHDPGLFTWYIMAAMCLMGGLGGILFYFIVIRPQRFVVCLCDVYGGIEESLFRTTNEPLAQEISQAIATATGLKHRRVL